MKNETKFLFGEELGDNVRIAIGTFSAELMASELDFLLARNKVASPHFVAGIIKGLRNE